MINKNEIFLVNSNVDFFYVEYNVVRGDIMKTVTRLMFNMYKIKDLGYDFMGYAVNKNNASYHHLIIPRRLKGSMTIENGAVLNGFTSHPYLHAIEKVDLDIFDSITSEMIDENIKGRVDIYNIKKIDDLLLFFEREHSGDYTKSVHLLIKEEYTKRMTR